MSALKHEVLLRLRAIELIACWEGRLITSQLMDWFGITRQQASSDINRYNAEFNPAALLHDPAVKGYVPSAYFRPVLTSGHMNDYLELIARHGDQSMAQVLETHPGVVAVQFPERAVRPEVVRELVRACRCGSSLSIRYASMSNPQPRERVISPHTLVHSGFRWHVRAWCHARQAFRDFLLSRIEQPVPCAAEGVPVAEDQFWNERVTLTLIPNQLLNDEQQALVERDFAMSEGRLQITVRKALVHYTLQRYQVAISEADAVRVREHPLQLLPTERPTLNPYLFGGEGQ